MPKDILRRLPSGRVMKKVIIILTVIILLAAGYFTVGKYKEYRAFDLSGMEDELSGLEARSAGLDEKIAAAISEEEDIAQSQKDKIAELEEWEKRTEEVKKGL